MKKTNFEKLKEMTIEEASKKMAREIYSIFRSSLTKKEFIEQIEKWMRERVEEPDDKKNRKLYEIDVKEDIA